MRRSAVFPLLGIMVLAASLLSSCATAGLEGIPKDPFLKREIAVAIYPFREIDRSYETDLSIYLRNYVENQIAENPRIKVCARDEALAHVLREMELELSGVIAERRGEQALGRLLNADYTIVGEISRRSSGDATLVLKYVEVTTGRIDHVAELRIPKATVAAVFSMGIRTIPSEYYDARVADIATALTDALKGKGSPQKRVFIAVTNQGRARMTVLDKYLHDGLRRNFSSLGFPVQKNLISEENTFPNLVSVQEALRTRLYSKNAYFVVDISCKETDQYYQYIVAVYDLGTSMQLVKTTEIVVEKNRAIIELQKKSN